MPGILEIVYIVCTLLLLLGCAGAIAYPAQPRWYSGIFLLVVIDLVIIGFKLFHA